MSKSQMPTLRRLKKKVSDCNRKIADFCSHLEGSITASPERTQNYSRCQKLRSEVEGLLTDLAGLSKSNEKNPPQDYSSQKKQMKGQLVELKGKLDKIAGQLEPDEVEEEYFRQIQSGGIAGSSSDLLSERDKEEPRPQDEAEDSEDDADYDESEEGDEEDDDVSDYSKTIVVHKVEALSDFAGDQSGDLSFKKGDILTILDPREDGWWLAEDSKGNKGSVPKTLLKILDEPEAETPAEQATPAAAAPNTESDGNVAPLTKQRSGKDLWKSLQKGSKQETSVTDVLKAMHAMPSGFRTSTLGRMARDEAFQISSWVVPKLRASNVAFRDLVWDPVEKQVHPRPVKTNRLFTVVAARMIPTPGAGVEVLSRYVRIIIWDCERKEPLSNIHSVRATCTERDPNTWTFSAKGTRSAFDAECFARIDSYDGTLSVLFELNFQFLRTSTGEKGEMSCGWGVLKLFENNGTPISNRNYELPINGGTPFQKNVELEQEVPLKGSSRFQSLIRSNRQARLTVKLASVQRREAYDSLPDVLLTCHQYTPFISYYRQLLAELLLKDKRDVQDADYIMDPVIATFPKTLHATDVMDALKRGWGERNKKEVKRSQRRDTSHMKRFFREVYMDIVFPIIHSAEIPAYIWGNEQREMERLSRIFGHYDKQSALDTLLSAERVHKPFNVDRVAFNLISKHCT